MSFAPSSFEDPTMDLDFDDVLLTPSDILEHLFCGRFTYFERYLLLPEFQERREKVRRGRDLHTRPGGDQPGLPQETPRGDGQADRREPGEPPAPPARSAG